MVATGPMPISTEAHHGSEVVRARLGQAAADVGGPWLLDRADRLDLGLDSAVRRVANPGDLGSVPSRSGAQRPGPTGDPEDVPGVPGVVVGRGTTAAGGVSRRRGDANRRTRIRNRVWQALVGWLHRITRCHAHLCAIVRLYGDPSRAGAGTGQYAKRAAEGDPTLLYDALTVTIDELVEVRNEIQQHMDSAEPTTAPPGSKAKVEAMARRMDRGESLFVDGDAGMRPG